MDKTKVKNAALVSQELILFICSSVDISDLQFVINKDCQ